MPETTKPTKESGTVILSSTGQKYTAPEITAELIVELMDNIYLKGVIQKQNNLLFTDPVYLEVTDADGNHDADVEMLMTDMTKTVDVDLWSKIQMAERDVFSFGPFLHNDVWEYVDNVYTLVKLRPLPAESFGDGPANATLGVYSQLLQGITQNSEGETEFYQTDDNLFPTKLENVTMLKDPTSNKLAGESVIIPIIPIISMLKFGWDTQMQQTNRTGSKILFLKVTDPMPASTENGDIGDIEAAKNILENWGKDNAYPLRGNMELVDPGIKDDSNNLDIISALNRMIIDYLSPIEVLTSDGDSARLGGNDNERGELIRRYIKSRHAIYENHFSRVLQPYLDVNGYDGYTVKVIIPLPIKDESEINIKRVEVGVQAKVLKPNAILKLLGQPEATDEELQDIEDYYIRQAPAIPQFNFSSGVATSAEADDIPEKSTDSIEAVGDRLARDTVAALELL